MICITCKKEGAPTKWKPCPDCELRSMGPGATMTVNGKITKYEDL